MLFLFSMLVAQLVVPSPAAAPSALVAESASSAVVAVASPCPSASSSPAGPGDAATPSALPTCAGIRTIATSATTLGRKANLVGKASAASEGTIDQEEIRTRPVLRPGEVLEAIPGLVISQHSGEGKANQYYLRGFQLDHGTDLEATILGEPINLPTHAHGQGYSDINWLIPELVSYVEFKKGTYYADQGDFSTAGAYNLFYRDKIDPVVEFGVGDFGYDRFFTAGSTAVGSGTLLYAAELLHDNGTLKKPDEYRKLNGVLRYSHETAKTSFAVTATAYDGPFDSTDQIPQRLVDSGQLSRFGYIDPSDGGDTYRYGISTQFERRDAHGKTNLDVYGVHTFLDLFSDFTYNLYDANDYYNVTANPVTCKAAYSTCKPFPGAQHVATYASYCPGNNTAPPNAAPGSVVPAPFSFSCGDQREQKDDRYILGFNLSRTVLTPGTTTTLGVGVRNDNAPVVGLYLTNDRNRYASGTLSNDHAVVRDTDAFLQSELRLGNFRATPGVRLDIINQRVDAYLPGNSGAATEAQLNPKLTLAYKLGDQNEFYADAGEGFHSNDARGVVGTLDPQTHATVDATGAAIGQNAVMTRGTGFEAGYRLSTPKLTTTVSYYQLLLANELVFDGDHGTNSVGGPTRRTGIEFANFYTPTKWLTLDADIATATANFIDDPDNAGTAVPESLNNVDSLGATVDESHYAASLRMRYFGPRSLEQTGEFKSPSSTIFNAQFTYKLPHHGGLSFDVFNLFDARVADVTYYYGSWLKQDAANPAYANDPAINPALGAAVPNLTAGGQPAGGTSGQSVAGGGVNDFHFHPSSARTVRLTYTVGVK